MVSKGRKTAAGCGPAVQDPPCFGLAVAVPASSDGYEDADWAQVEGRLCQIALKLLCQMILKVTH